MTKREGARLAHLIEHLCANPSTRLLAGGDGHYRLASTDERTTGIAPDAVARLLAAGLLVEAEPRQFAAADAARAWLSRRTHPHQPFRVQHGGVETRQADVGGPDVLVNLDESPVAALARRSGKDGKPWLSPDLLVAAERLRRDFEVGRLQPRVTANWSASVNSGRRTGDSGGLTDLTDMALAARLRVDRALDGVGPEFAGLLIDSCCFLKGLETIERERQWPSRSAKLVLRLALQSLARHYGLAPVATGAAGARLRHWAAADFRPVIT